MYISLNERAKAWDINETVVSNSGKSYEIGDKIGNGGNGGVYECIDNNGNVLAIKFLLQFGFKIKNRFYQEISLLKSICCNHVVRYIDDGVIEGKTKGGVCEEIPFIVMEKADENLINYMKKNLSVEYDVYAAQFRGLCEALEELHKYAIHRDIKPENILIKGETWLLSDFGLCEFINSDDHQDLTATYEKVGPALWMSPEAVNSYYFGTDTIGTYSDVFQLCAVFAFVLTRSHPGGVISDSNNLNTTSNIRQLILKSLSNDIKDRPQNGHELAEMYSEATLTLEI